MTREEAINTVRNIYQTDKEKEALATLIPELAESEDGRIIRLLRELGSLDVAKELYEEFNLSYTDVLYWLEKQKECVSNNFDDVWDEEDCEEIITEGQKLTPRFKELLKEVCHAWYDRGAKLEKQKEQKPVKMEVYEVGKGTTVCGQDYKCKKDYQAGNCRYIKDAIYHCGRDGYLTDQNGISWSCTPEWFNEYIQSNTEWAEEEKTRFVSGQFLQCKLSFDSFKEGEHYWLEYVGDDMYVGRSDNVLGQRFHITPRQLYTLFSQQLEEVQGPPQEEKQVPLTYEPPFNENPSDKEIIEALIKHLKEQDSFLTAINCVSTKAILSWLEKQQEQKPVDYETELKKCKNNPLYFFDKYVSTKQKPIEWSEEDEEMLKDIISGLKAQKLLIFAHENQGKAQMNARIDWLQSLPERFNLQPKPEWSEEDEEILKLLILNIGRYMYFGGMSSERILSFLKSLRPQPKKGYSDEDEDRISDVLWCIEQSRKVAKNENDMGTCWSAERFVKSLRPQQRQEWSDEEKEILDSILSHYVLIDKPIDANGISKEKYISLIKSIRFDTYKNCNSHWKPSEEQMKALNEIVNILAESPFLHQNDYLFNILNGLREELKKLL